MWSLWGRGVFGLQATPNDTPTSRAHRSLPPAGSVVANPGFSHPLYATIDDAPDSDRGDSPKQGAAEVPAPPTVEPHYAEADIGTTHPPAAGPQRRIQCTLSLTWKGLQPWHAGLRQLVERSMPVLIPM